MSDIEAIRLANYKAYIEAQRTESALWEIHNLARDKKNTAREVYHESLKLDTTKPMTDEEVQSRLCEIRTNLLAFQDATAEEGGTLNKWGRAKDATGMAKAVWEESEKDIHKKRPSEEDLRAYAKARYDYLKFSIKYRELREKISKNKSINLCIDETLDQDQNVECMVSKLDKFYRELIEDEHTLLLMKGEADRICDVWCVAGRLCNFPRDLNISNDPADEPADVPAPRRRTRIRKTKTTIVS